jgi:hypothetical protein
LVHVDKQGDDDAPLAGMTGFQTLPVEAGLDVAEQPEFHRHPA